MGYRKGRKIFVLEFADPEFDGLEVKARSMPIGELRQYMDDDEAGGYELVDAFTRALVSWNLEEDDGTPVPVTAEGVNGQDAEFMMKIVTAWFATMSGVQDGTPLDGASDSGNRFPEASLPMETLSPSLAS